MEIDTQLKTPENPDPTLNVPPVESPIRRPSINPVVFPELPPAPRPTELKLASPKPFTGNREDLNGFLLDLNLYLTVNNEIYDTSFKKIGYALSFMTSGDAKSWKDQYLKESNWGEYLDLGTWSEFTEALWESFELYDAPGDAMDKIINLKKGDTSVDDHIAKYKILLRKAKIPEDSLPAVDYFLRSLLIPLQRDLLRLPTPPKDLKEWYSWASKLDNNFKRMQRILGWSTGKTSEKAKEEPRQKWNIRRRDPDTMDVDALDMDKHMNMMRKGLCFNCNKAGHISKFCPEKWRVTASTSTPTSPPSYALSPAATSRKINLKELVDHIRSMAAQMGPEEKEEFLDEAEKEGF